MKKTLFYLCFALAYSAGLAGCSNDDDGAKGDGFVHVKNVYTTGCKTEGVPQNSNNVTGLFSADGYGEYIEYKSKDDGYVYVTHANVLFNCCSEKVNVDVSLQGNNIIVTETETDSSCNCICPFDVSFELGKLVPGQYSVKIMTNGLEQASFAFKYPSDGKVVIGK